MNGGLLGIKLSFSGCESSLCELSWPILSRHIKSSRWLCCYLGSSVCIPDSDSSLIWTSPCGNSCSSNHAVALSICVSAWLWGHVLPYQLNLRPQLFHVLAWEWLASRLNGRSFPPTWKSWPSKGCLIDWEGTIYTFISVAPLFQASCTPYLMKNIKVL